MRTKHKTRLTIRSMGLIILLIVLGVTATIAYAFTEPNFVSFTLEGCRNNGSIILPINGKFVCPDAAYTTGNLGKGWNELDLVPHRITTNSGNQKEATTDYNIYIAGDYQTSGKVGWDVISVPVVNSAKSDASCSISAGPQSTQGSAASPFGGGTDVVIYRLLTIHQNKNTTCVFDYYQRLALGAHLYPGSSLQSYMFDKDGLSGSKKTISIPVNEILPQEISKDMSATQGTDHVWDITKESTPATLSFGNTCAPGGKDPQGLELTITWTKGPANPKGPITVITHVYAKNPAARVITTDVTDVIYSGTTMLDSASSGPVDVPANTANLLLLTHTVQVPAGTTDLNDIATATYTDKVTGVPVPGTTTATASAPVQFSGPELNQTAIINDVESITGSFLSFSADSFSPAIGAFDGGYVPGTVTTGPVSWTSTSQSDSGSVTFQKSVYVSQASIATGQLSDTATLTGSDGARAQSSLEVNISTNAVVSLTINKTIDVAQSSDTSFVFKVLDGATQVAEATVTILAGQTSGSTVVPDLMPDVMYTIDEVDQNGWKPNDDQYVTISLPSCSSSVEFLNTSPKDLTISKTATPSFTRTYAWDITKDVNGTNVKNISGGVAIFDYIVNVTHDSGTDSAWKVEGVITVTNPNDWVDVTADVNDALPGASCSVTGGTGVTVPGGGHVDLPYSCTFASQPAYNTDLTNTATATWDAASYGTPNGSASYEKKLQFTSAASIVNGSVNVTDSLAGYLGTASYTDPNPTSFTYSLSFPGVGGTCTNYDNTAKISYSTADQAFDSDTETVKVCVGLDLTVTKTATPSFTRTYAWEITKNVVSSALKNISGGVATFDYQVDVTHDNGMDSAWAVAGTITVTNPNNWEDIVADVNDALSGASCSVTGGTGVTVAAGGHVELPYSCTFATQPAYNTDLTNTATATWDAATYFTTSGSASNEKKFQFTAPTKIVNGSVNVTDAQAPNPPLPATVSYTDPSPKSFNYSLSFPGVGGTCTDYDNTAKISYSTPENAFDSDTETVTVCVGLDLTVTKSASGTFDREYFWEIFKNAQETTVSIAEGNSYTFHYTVNVNQTSFKDSGWEVHGAIIINNPNDFEDVTLTSLTDVVDNGGVCTVDAGPHVVPASDSLTVNYTCSYASKPANYSGTNTATAAWDKTAAHSPSGSASDDASFTLTKDQTTNATVHVTDSYAGSLGILTATDPPADPASTSFSYTRTESGVSGKCTTYDNTATITETGQTAKDSVELCVGANLTVSKTATTTFARTYAWTIDKSVDKTKVILEGANPQSATFNYTVAVSHNSGTDSAWAITGTITVENPNEWEAITLTDVTDIAGGTACTVDKSVGMVVPAKSGGVNGKATFAYSCSMPNGDSGENVATATWNKATYSTPSDTATGKAAFAFTTPTTIVDGSVNVVDDKTDPANPATLGTVSYTDPSPKKFTYSLTKSGVSGKCTDYNNTATFTTNTTGTTDSDSQKVTVCSSNVTVLKLTKGPGASAPAVDPTQNWTFNLYQGPDGFGSSVLASDSTSNDADGLLDFDFYNQNPAKTYTICELNVPSGWTAEWKIDTNGDGTPDTIVIPYNPNADDAIPQDLGNRCFDFGANTSYSIPEGGTLAFQVINEFPGGSPRTPGYWKNWNRCTGGGQAANADRNGGRAKGYTLLEDILTSPGIIWDDILSDNVLVPITSCEQAVEILDQRVVTANGKVGDGKKLASDGLRTLAMHLLAAQLNEANGACIKQDVKDVILKGETLLDKYNFDGKKTTEYLTSKDKTGDYAYALKLAQYLDAYNNSNCNFATLPPKP